MHRSVDALASGVTAACSPVRRTLKRIARNIREPCLLGVEVASATSDARSDAATAAPHVQLRIRGRWARTVCIFIIDVPPRLNCRCPAHAYSALEKIVILHLPTVVPHDGVSVDVRAKKQQGGVLTATSAVSIFPGGILVIPIFGGQTVEMAGLHMARFYGRADPEPRVSVFGCARLFHRLRALCGSDFFTDYRTLVKFCVAGTRNYVPTAKSGEAAPHIKFVNRGHAMCVYFASRTLREQARDSDPQDATERIFAQTKDTGTIRIVSTDVEPFPQAIAATRDPSVELTIPPVGQDYCDEAVGGNDGIGPGPASQAAAGGGRSTTAAPAAIVDLGFLSSGQAAFFAGGHPPQNHRSKGQSRPQHKATSVVSMERGQGDGPPPRSQDMSATPGIAVDNERGRNVVVRDGEVFVNGRRIVGGTPREVLSYLSGADNTNSNCNTEPAVYRNGLSVEGEAPTPALKPPRTVQEVNATEVGSIVGGPTQSTAASSSSAAPRGTAGLKDFFVAGAGSRPPRNTGVKIEKFFPNTLAQGIFGVRPQQFANQSPATTSVASSLSWRSAAQNQSPRKLSAAAGKA